MVLISASFVLASFGARAQGPDPHLASDPSRNLYQSAFVHGYIHGYENGFHVGDMDWQLGHESQVATAQKVHGVDNGYQPTFGDKHVFMQGFQQGLHIGYEDAYRDDVFRGIAQVRRAAEGVTAEDAGKRDFDKAVAAGYMAGLQEGKRHPLTSTDSKSPGKTCVAERRPAVYCDAYGRGFSLGYADGSLVQTGRGAQTAQASHTVY
jgi:hypothetical protein